MIATFINAAAVVLGATLGLALRRLISDRYRAIVYSGIGLITLVIGFRLSLDSRQIVYLALAVTVGGLLGEWWRIEDGITWLGDRLRRLLQPRAADRGFATAFLDASVLFCVGALTLIGSFQAGTQGDYQLLLTKSVLDGFMAVLLAAALGVGVAFAAVTILVYQGALTLLAATVQPLVSAALLAELSAVGGVLILMIGVNLLGLRQLKTANFLPAFLVMVPLVIVAPLSLLSG